MQEIQIVSFVLNIGLIVLCLSLVYPKLIQRYNNGKKQRENHRVKEIQKIVNDYLKSLQND